MKDRSITLPRVRRLLAERAMKAWRGMEHPEKDERIFNQGYWMGVDLSVRLIGIILNNRYSSKSNWKH